MLGLCIIVFQIIEKSNAFYRFPANIKGSAKFFDPHLLVGLAVLLLMKSSWIQKHEADQYFLISLVK